MIIPWGCLLVEGVLLGLMAYIYTETGLLGYLMAAIFIFGCYIYAGVMLIQCMRLDKDIAQLKEGTDFYKSYIAGEAEEGEEWKA